MNPYELITGEVYHERARRWPRLRLALAALGLTIAGYYGLIMAWYALCAPGVEC